MRNDTLGSSDLSRLTSHASQTLIDTHCHLEMKQFDADRDAVIKRAINAGVESFITVGSDFDHVKKCIALSEKYDPVYASIGIHPHDAKDFTETIYSTLKEWSKKEKVIAIGETGLDYHYDHSARETQREVFRKHLSLAKETGLPAVIHSREAKQDTLEILRSSGINKGVMHCFSGDRDMAEQVMAMGLYISIAGPVTFQKSFRLREIARTVPDDYLLIETDAPYLAPEPFRGKRNEPAYIQHTARHIAELRGISLDDLARITTLNAKQLFGIGIISEKPAIAYKIRDSLYLNITNRCTNKCSFCVKFHSDYVKGHKLKLDHEPTEEEIMEAIGNPSDYKEVVFCGYGEPLYRLEVVKKIAGWIKEHNGQVRINTNGHANLIHKRNITPELKGIVDRLSVSLDAHDQETYNRICRPVYKNSFNDVIDFIRKAKEAIPEVQATVVEIEGVDIEKCRQITDILGVVLRVRRFNVVG